MRIQCGSSALALCLCVNLAFGASVFVKPDQGQTQLKRAAGGPWLTVVAQSEMLPGDSLCSGQASSMTVGDSTVFLLKDSCTIALQKDSTGVLALALCKGELFMNRHAGADSTRVRVLALGCAFDPVGTAAAFKITKKGDPSVAVLRGAIRVTAPGGATRNVGAGFFSTLDQASATLSEPLQIPAKALDALQAWSGVTVEAPLAAAVPAPQASASPAAPSANVPLSSTAGAAAATAPSAPSPDTSSKTSAQKTSLPADTSHKNPAPVQAQPPAGAASAGAGAAKPAATNEKPAAGAAGGPEKPHFEVSASNATVSGEQWTRLGFAVDVPFWRFGVCFDLELWLNSQGQFTDKGWNFDRNDWLESLTRKIRYIRFNHETDPVFVKVGGLDNVTLGYGFVVDNFTNMLHYPDQKLFGMQFYLNDLSPIGVTLQAVVPDFLDFQDNGGILAARLGVRPLKPTGIPILSGLCVAGTYAVDLNQYAPAHAWHYTGNLKDKNNNGLIDSDWAWQNVRGLNGAFFSANKGILFDTTDMYPKIDTTYRDSTAMVSIVGGDASIPIVKSPVFGLDVYGQAGMNLADKSGLKSLGWGVGVPGVALTLGPAWARAEFRHIQGRFEPGYFGTYYLDERLVRTPVVQTKEQTLVDEKLNGVYGTLGADIFHAVTLSGSYQRLVGDNNALDQRFDATLGIGQLIVSHIPKVKKVEGFFSKTGIQNTVVNPVRQDGDAVRYDAFFEKTPSTYWGYRLGLEVLPGATIIWETRYGWAFDESGNLVDNNSVTIGAGLSF